MIGDILQPTHLLFLLVIVLIVLGPKRLPETARALGRGLRDFKNAISGDDNTQAHELPQAHEFQQAHEFPQAQELHQHQEIAGAAPASPPQPVMAPAPASTAVAPTPQDPVEGTG